MSQQQPTLSSPKMQVSAHVLHHASSYNLHIKLLLGWKITLLTHLLVGYVVLLVKLVASNPPLYHWDLYYVTAMRVLYQSFT